MEGKIGQSAARTFLRFWPTSDDHLNRAQRGSLLKADRPFNREELLGTDHFIEFGGL